MYTQGKKKIPICKDEEQKLILDGKILDDNTKLIDLNLDLISLVCNYLGIRTQLSSSSDYPLEDGRIGRLLGICLNGKADYYYSGPSAKDYIDESVFARAGISVKYMNYSNYPEYTQLWGDFVHNVSILDLLFNCGEYSLDFIHSKN